MRNGIDYLHLHQLVFEQVQTPLLMACGWRTAHQRNQMGFAYTIQLARLALLLRLVRERRQCALGKTLSHPHHGGSAGMHFLADDIIGTATTFLSGIG